jgi:catechol 2,3-dioxygenase-like lactoylglutathione lyase family enzyme
VELNKLDHVALWVADRDSIAELATGHLGMHVIERTDRFTLVGSHARHGKLTLFEAEAPRERGRLRHVALRVPDLDRAIDALPEHLPVAREDGLASVEAGEGLRIALVEAPSEVEYDLDHVALVAPDPEETAARYGDLGFEAASPGPAGAPRVEVGGAWIEFHAGDVEDGERPLLNHLGVLVSPGDVDAWRRRVEERGVEVADVVDAPNTYAVFVWGPDRVKLEYVEHKPSFSLT